LAFLARWPDASVNARLASLCCCPDLHTVLRRELLEILWKREPALALMILRGAIGEPALLPLARWVLPCLCRSPRLEDREFYRWILQQEAHPVIRYHAVEALERLGEDGDVWRERLVGMARSPDPYLRVHALSALAQRGETAALARLEQIATRARHVCVRAEAIRVLGELDAARYLNLLRRALLEDHAMCGPCPSDLPAAEEAAIALCHLGTPEALTAVVHGYLTVPCQDLQTWIGEWLREADERRQGSPIPRRTACWGACRLNPVGRGYRRWLEEVEEEP
jgi:HEAT repeat protein